MPATVRDLAYLVIEIPVIGMFAHVVALIALSPILYFFWSPDKPSRRWAALLAGTPIVWAMMFYGSYLGRQFLQAPSAIGIMVGAGVSTALMSWGFGNSWFEKREWIGIVMLFGFPALGYILGHGLE